MSLQFRRADGADTEEIRSDVNGPDVLQLERKGDIYTMSVARFGDTYAAKAVDGVTLGDEVYVGVYVCAHNPDGVRERPSFSNVRLIRPAERRLRARTATTSAATWNCSTCTTGARRVVHQVADSIQAPNWTPDGKRLLMNRNGRMYSFDLASRTIADIDTGSMTRNNNDHALSFDGKMLGLSGGQPSVGLHGARRRAARRRRSRRSGRPISTAGRPDGKFLAFTGQRNGDYDIYLVPVRRRPRDSGSPPRRASTTARSSRRTASGSTSTPRARAACRSGA